MKIRFILFGYPHGVNGESYPVGRFSTCHSNHCKKCRAKAQRRAGMRAFPNISRPFARSSFGPPLGPRDLVRRSGSSQPRLQRGVPAAEKAAADTFCYAKAALRSTGHDRPHLDDFEVAS